MGARYVIVKGDCRDVLDGDRIPPNHFDGCVTDTPYGLGSDGHASDTFSPDLIWETEQKHQCIDNKLQTFRSGSMAAGEYDYTKNPEFQEFTKTWAERVFEVLKPGAFL